MSQEFELQATVRTDSGKGASRRLRRLNNEIPAVLYGGHKDPVSLTILHKDIAKAIENEAFFSHVITLKIGNKSEQAVIKDLQRHPAKTIVMHADFLRVSANEPITVNVPIHFLNEEKCVGVRIGHGTILRTLNEIEIKCLPRHLPEYIEVDLLELDVGDSIHLSEITMPEGVTCLALEHGDENDDLSVVILQAPRVDSDEDQLEDEAAAAASAASEEAAGDKKAPADDDSDGDRED
ncbi:MAG: 50S ribosomal protein L25/general stress protein Ctc [Proteobacteria bacterium]|nr:50S ribosomal protein L25/general stress protein Ctc [Pseudomonadota bacterium]